LGVRATWVVLGALLVGGGAAYWHLRWNAGDGAGAAPEGGSSPAARPLLEHNVPTPGSPTPSEDPTTGHPDEAEAVRLLQEIERAKEARDGARHAAALKQLQQEAWDAPSARRFAVQSGWSLAREAARLEGVARIQALDRARRLLSRGVLLPEYFDAGGLPTAERGKLTTAIQTSNAQVMTYKPGLAGVTRPHVVAPGAVPVQIVSNERLETGHNALLYWNKRGNLDPKRLVAGETLLLPLEELVVHVEVERRLLVLFLGDVFVKEFRVGVGKPETPTPRGEFTVGKKQENPDWYPSGRGRVPAGDPRNELGSVWIHIQNEQYPTGYGIHGTNHAETIGSACSEGCVRLANEDASEVYWWVRMATNGGKATRVRLR
jgi:hypothetical protein